METVDPLARTKAVARQWLRYQNPDLYDVRVKVAKYGEHRAGGLGDEGAPLDALRSSQCWHAAHHLEAWLFDAAIWRRSFRMDSQVTRRLWENHGDPWRTFVAQFPVSPLPSLLVQIADQMAEVLGPDPF